MKFNKVLNALFFIAVSFLAGCVATPPAHLSDDKPISNNNGILIVGLDTDWEGHKNPLLASLELIYTGENDPGLGYRTLTFHGRNHFAVLELPTKMYHFRSLEFGARYLLIDDKEGFFIKPNTINYIGNITSNVSISGFSATTSIRVDDKHEEAKLFLKNNYPNLFSKYNFNKKLVPINDKN